MSLTVYKINFLQNFISSRDGPVKSTETKQRWKHKKAILQYYGMTGEKRQENYPTSAIADAE